MAVWISGQRAEGAALQDAESTRRLAISDLLAPISPGTTGAAGTAIPTPAAHTPAATPLHSRSLAIAAPADDLGDVLPSLPFGSAAPQPPTALAAAPHSHAAATAAAPAQQLGRGSRGAPHTQLATRSRPLGSELRPLGTRSTALHIGGHVSRAHTSKGRASGTYASASALDRRTLPCPSNELQLPGGRPLPSPAYKLAGDPAPGLPLLTPGLTSTAVGAGHGIPEEAAEQLPGADVSPGAGSRLATVSAPIRAAMGRQPGFPGSAANAIHTSVDNAVATAFHTVHTNKDGDADESVGEPVTCLARLRGVGVYYTDSADGMPPVMWQFLQNVEAVHEVRARGARRAHVWAG